MSLSGVSRSTRSNQAIGKQLDYYTAIANSYDEAADQAYERDVSLHFISAFIHMLGIESILDTGCGTGHGIRYLLDNHPGLSVVANDFSQDLLDVAVNVNGIPRDRVVRASSDSLPFGDEEFDAVLEIGLLHHVARPNDFVAEMARVAKKAVFISDFNRFGGAKKALRPIRAILYWMRLWGLANWVNTRGKGYSESPGDGIAYSYSVFDSIPTLARRVDQIITLPTRGDRIIGGIAFFQASHLLVCGLKKRLFL